MVKCASSYRSAHVAMHRSDCARLWSAEVDLDDSTAPSDEQGGGGGGRTRPANAHLAKQLRGELALLLAQPLTRKSQFTTGDSATKAAAAAAASNFDSKSKPAVSAVALQKGDPSGRSATGEGLQPSAVLRGADGPKGTETGQAAVSRQNRPKTLAQLQAHAMQKALHAQRMKKAGKRKGRSQIPTGSGGPNGVSALQVLRGGGLSGASD